MATFKNVPTASDVVRSTSTGLANTTDPVTFTVGAATNWPTSNFWITVWDRATYLNPNDDPNMEVLLCASRTGTSLAGCVRGALGTIAVSHANGSAVAVLIQGKLFDDIHTAINAVDAPRASDLGLPNVAPPVSDPVVTDRPGSLGNEFYSARYNAAAALYAGRSLL